VKFCTEMSKKRGKGSRLKGRGLPKESWKRDLQENPWRGVPSWPIGNKERREEGENEGRREEGTQGVGISLRENSMGDAMNL